MPPSRMATGLCPSCFLVIQLLANSLEKAVEHGPSLWDPLLHGWPTRALDSWFQPNLALTIGGQLNGYHMNKDTWLDKQIWSFQTRVWKQLIDRFIGTMYAPQCLLPYPMWHSVYQSLMSLINSRYWPSVCSSPVLLSTPCIKSIAVGQRTLDQHRILGSEPGMKDLSFWCNSVFRTK